MDALIQTQCCFLCLPAIHKTIDCMHFSRYPSNKDYKGIFSIEIVIHLMQIL
ncbi:hypothetical protein HMPREF1869_00875 [Bacteroidales bacterium KA00251]|nr:hypothetical protein HMPREF1869_00875 [Bacteroidales bacterium KA00251]